jgi:hypothetical protein
MCEGREGREKGDDVHLLTLRAGRARVSVCPVASVGSMHSIQAWSAGDAVHAIQAWRVQDFRV